MVHQTSGHMTTSQGIRGHSAGDTFPYVVVVKGSWADGFTYHVIGNGRTIKEKSTAFTCLSAAFRAASALKWRLGQARGW